MKMAKNNIVKKDKELLEDNSMDFSSLMNTFYDDEVMSGMMNNMVEASNHQMVLAIELTKLAVEKTSKQNMNEEDVFATFKKASAVIAENFPFNSLWEKFSANT